MRRPAATAAALASRPALDDLLDEIQRSWCRVKEGDARALGLTP